MCSAWYMFIIICKTALRKWCEIFRLVCCEEWAGMTCFLSLYCHSGGGTYRSDAIFTYLHISMVNIFFLFSCWHLHTTLRFKSYKQFSLCRPWRDTSQRTSNAMFSLYWKYLVSWSILLVIYINFISYWFSLCRP